MGSSLSSPGTLRGQTAKETHCDAIWTIRLIVWDRRLAFCDGIHTQNRVAYDHRIEVCA